MDLNAIAQIYEDSDLRKRIRGAVLFCLPTATGERRTQLTNHIHQNLHFIVNHVLIRLAIDPDMGQPITDAALTSKVAAIIDALFAEKVLS
jgi:hypothetical protein